MKDDDDLPISTPTTHTTTSSTISKKESSDSSIFGRGRYKFWALSAILLLAFWSMLTGTVTLRWSAGNLNRLSDDIDTPIHDYLDVLEIEEREKVVKHMWDVYTNSRRIRLPRFWQEAFVAAYEDLTSDVPEVREAAISEIAKMSVHSIDLEPPPLQSTTSFKACKLSIPTSFPRATTSVKKSNPFEVVFKVKTTPFYCCGNLNRRCKSVVRELNLKQAEQKKAVTSAGSRL